MSSSLSPFSFNPLPLPSLFRKPLSSPLHLQSSPIPNRYPPSLLAVFHTLAALTPSPHPSGSDEEQRRWLREEQRWLREEQRWLREERRWSSERERLVQEIAELKLKTRSLDRDSPEVSETLAKFAEMLQVFKDSDSAKARWITEKGSGGKPMVSEAAEREEEEEEVKDLVVEEVVRISGGIGEERTVKEPKKVVALRKGSEGEDVRAMQDALQKLGFYSGEEDMEFSSFSSGTERAVKTWQASVGAPENGIMTAELLEKLYVEQQITSFVQSPDPKRNDTSFLPEDGANGAAVVTLTKFSEVHKTVVQEDVSEVDASQHRVFLLGENRWEDSSRLAGRDKQSEESETGDATTKCVACQGEGRVLCIECDGTGEPNIEPQFMEWTNEAMKCPYCDGVGTTICDVCEGEKKVKV